MGGTEFDNGLSITLDSKDNVYVAGLSTSTDFPTTNDSFDREYNGGEDDAVISKLSPDLSDLLSSTYLGGNGFEQVYSIILDKSDNIYVVGYTDHSRYPTTAEAFDQIYSRDEDGIVSKLSPDLTGSFRVEAFAGINGTLDSGTPSPQNITIGETANFTFHANNGYHVETISGCGISFSNLDIDIINVNILTEEITESCVVNAAFANNTHGVLSLSVRGGGQTRCQVFLAHCFALVIVPRNIL